MSLAGAKIAAEILKLVAETWDILGKKREDERLKKIEEDIAELKKRGNK